MSQVQMFMVMLRTNDFSTGSCTGHVDAIEVFREQSEGQRPDTSVPCLALTAPVAIRFNVSGFELEIGGYKFRPAEQQNAFGNRAWRACWVTKTGLFDLLNGLDRSVWELEMATPSLGSVWQEGESFNTRTVDWGHINDDEKTTTRARSRN